MATTILEALVKEKPNGSHVKNESLRIVYLLVKQHIVEIEEARELGYSWMQIEEACRELWKGEEKASRIVWWKTKSLVGSCYHAIRKGILPKDGLKSMQKKASSPNKKYSVVIAEE